MSLWCPFLRNVGSSSQNFFFCNKNFHVVQYVRVPCDYREWVYVSLFSMFGLCGYSISLRGKYKKLASSHWRIPPPPPMFKLRGIFPNGGILDGQNFEKRLTISSVDDVGGHSSNNAWVYIYCVWVLELSQLGNGPSEKQSLMCWTFYM